MKLFLSSILLLYGLSSISQNSVKIDSLSNSVLRYQLFYPNGQLEEEGFWKKGRNIGKFRRFHENGTLAQDFFFNSNGKREGIQNYYFKNGSLALIGYWNAGQIEKFSYLNPVEENELINPLFTQR